MISDALRCIFIHIPKCAGTSIEDALWPHPRTTAELWGGFIDEFRNPYQTGGLQHLTAATVRDVVGPERFEAYYRFAVVRNPWDRAVSQYVFMRRRPDLCRFSGLAPDAPFTSYLHAIAAAPPHVQWEAQYRFIYDDAGRLLVHDVLRFERLAEEMTRVFERLGVHASLERRNVGERLPLQHYYDAEARELVARRYATDIERFGYTFPG